MTDTPLVFGAMQKAPVIARFVMHPALFAVVTSSVFSALALQLWNFKPGIPLEYGSDAVVHGLHMQQIVQNGWIWNDDRLNAPFAQHMQDWPIGDITSLVTAWILALFTNNWAAVQNGMYLLSFPLTALAAWWVFQKLGLRPWTASIMGVLFSLLPYHFIRGEVHLFLSNYYVVPFAVYLAVMLAEGQSLFGMSTRYTFLPLRFATRRTFLTLSMATLVGLGGIYYAAFALLLIGVAFLVRLLQRRPVWPSVAVAAAIFFVVVGTVAPTLLYHANHGVSAKSVDRQPFESEFFGLKLTQMLVPADGHRISALDELQDRYVNDFPVPSERGSAALGVVASIGLIAILLLASSGLMSNGRAKLLSIPHIGTVSLLALSGFLVATLGGFASVIALTISPEIRSWNRMSIVIGFCALAIAGLLLDALLSRIKPQYTMLKKVLLGFVMLVGLLDQLTPAWIPKYESVGSQFLSDQAYFRQLENDLDSGASVLQLPLVDFPEGEVKDGAGTDGLYPYLHTSSVKWSFGGMRGRVNSEWKQRIDTSRADALVRDVAAVGYSGVLIDRVPAVGEFVELERELSELLGTAPRVSSNGRFAFFDVRDYARSLTGPSLDARRDELLFPVAVVNLKDFKSELDFRNVDGRVVGKDRGEVQIDNTSGRTTRVEARITLAAMDAPVRLRVTWPDGRDELSNIGTDPVELRSVFDAGPGLSSVELKVQGVDEDSVHSFRVIKADVLNVGGR